MLPSPLPPAELPTNVPALAPGEPALLPIAVVPPPAAVALVPQATSPATAAVGAGRRGVTADTALRVARYFRTVPRFG